MAGGIFVFFSLSCVALGGNALTATAADGKDLKLSSQTPATEYVAGKQVIICHPERLVACLQQAGLDVSLAPELLSLLGYRSALVRPLSLPDIAGLVLFAPEREMNSISASLGSQMLTLELKEQPQLTLWHELGHLQLAALKGNVLPAELPLPMEEALADAYLMYRVAHSRGELSLAWQQYHRRNLQAMASAGLSSPANLSHWSSLYLQALLGRYSASDLTRFSDFGDFCAALYPQLPDWSEQELAEFGNLLRQWLSASTPVMPGYLYWRKDALTQTLEPSLAYVLGREQAKGWLATLDDRARQ